MYVYMYMYSWCFVARQGFHVMLLSVLVLVSFPELIVALTSQHVERHSNFEFKNAAKTQERDHCDTLIARCNLLGFALEMRAATFRCELCEIRARPSRLLRMNAPATRRPKPHVHDDTSREIFLRREISICALKRRGTV